MSGIFNASIFNNAIFNTGAAAAVTAAVISGVRKSAKRELIVNLKDASREDTAQFLKAQLKLRGHVPFDAPVTKKPKAVFTKGTTRNLAREALQAMEAEREAAESAARSEVEQIGMKMKKHNEIATILLLVAK